MTRIGVRNHPENIQNVIETKRPVQNCGQELYDSEYHPISTETIHEDYVSLYSWQAVFQMQPDHGDFEKVFKKWGLLLSEIIAANVNT